MSIHVLERVSRDACVSMCSRVCTEVRVRVSMYLYVRTEVRVFAEDLYDSCVPRGQGREGVSQRDTRGEGSVEKKGPRVLVVTQMSERVDY